MNYFDNSDCGSFQEQKWAEDHSRCRPEVAEVFQGMESGYEGAVVEANGRKYRFDAL